MVVYFLVGVVMAVVVALIAGRKGRNAFGWMLLGLVLWPVALLAILLLPKTPETERRDAIESGDAFPCPACAELIKKEAKKCRFCGTDATATTSR